MEAIPCQPGIGATAQPSLPDVLGGIPEAAEAGVVAEDPVVRVVPAQLGRQLLPLLAHRAMSELTTPHLDCTQRATEAILGRLAHDGPLAPPGASPEVREAE